MVEPLFLGDPISFAEPYTYGIRSRFMADPPGRASVPQRVIDALRGLARTRGRDLAPFAHEIVLRAARAALDGYDLGKLEDEKARFQAKLHDLLMSRPAKEDKRRIDLASYVTGLRPTTFRAMVTSVAEDPEWWVQAAENWLAAVKAVKAFVEDGGGPGDADDGPKKGDKKSARKGVERK